MLPFRSGPSDMFFRTANFFNERRSGGSSDSCLGSSHSAPASRSSSREPSQIFGSQEPLFESQKLIESSDIDQPNTAYDKFVALKPLVCSDRKLGSSKTSLASISSRCKADNPSSSALQAELQHYNETLQSLSANVEIVGESLKEIRNRGIAENDAHTLSLSALNDLMNNLFDSFQTILGAISENKQMITSLPVNYQKEFSEKIKEVFQQNEKMLAAVTAAQHVIEKYLNESKVEMDKHFEILNSLKDNTELKDQMQVLCDNISKVHECLSNHIEANNGMLSVVVQENCKRSSVFEKLVSDHYERFEALKNDLQKQDAKLSSISAENSWLRKDVSKLWECTCNVEDLLKEETKLLREQKVYISSSLECLEKEISHKMYLLADEIKESMKNEFSHSFVQLMKKSSSMEKDLHSVLICMESLINVFNFPLPMPVLDSACAYNASTHDVSDGRLQNDSFSNWLSSIPSGRKGHIQKPMSVSSLQNTPYLTVNKNPQMNAICDYPTVNSGGNTNVLYCTPFSSILKGDEVVVKRRKPNMFTPHRNAVPTSSTKIIPVAKTIGIVTPCVRKLSGSHTVDCAPAHSMNKAIGSLVIDEIASELPAESPAKSMSGYESSPTISMEKLLDSSHSKEKLISSHESTSNLHVKPPCPGNHLDKMDFLRFSSANTKNMRSSVTKSDQLCSHADAQFSTLQTMNRLQFLIQKPRKHSEKVSADASEPKKNDQKKKCMGIAAKSSIKNKAFLSNKKNNKRGINKVACNVKKNLIGNGGKTELGLIKNYMEDLSRKSCQQSAVMCTRSQTYREWLASNEVEGVIHLD